MGSVQSVETTLAPAAAVCRDVGHSFVYRWLIARGVIAGSYPSPYAPLSQSDAREIFFYQRGASARMAGKVCVPDGSIVGFWNKDNELVHSMIALHSDTWIGAQNHRCFGLDRDQKLIEGVSVFCADDEHPYGWIADGNRWLEGDSELTVTFITPKYREF